ncbi:MAG: hypothetical protein ACUVWR_13605 [Anaerolineae bacterium]
MAIAFPWQISHIIESVLGRHGICLPYTANGLRFTPDGRPQFHFLTQDDPTCTRLKHPCSGCKPESWRLWKAKGYQVTYIGDGATDFCMADHFKNSATPGDLLFAKKRLLAYCREQAIPAVPFDTLYDVAAYLEHLAEPEETLPL